MNDTTDNDTTPSDPVVDGAASGRGPAGRFGPGNSFSRGNPHARRIAQIRAALMEACDPERIKKAAEALMVQAEGGDRFALAELLDRTLGRPVSADLEERLSALEQALLEDKK